MLFLGQTKVRNGKLKDGLSRIVDVEPCPLLRQDKEMATMSLTFAVAAPSLSLPSTPSLTKLHNHVLHVKPLHCTPIHQNVPSSFLLYYSIYSTQTLHPPHMFIVDQGWCRCRYHVWALQWKRVVSLWLL